MNSVTVSILSIVISTITSILVSLLYPIHKECKARQKYKKMVKPFRECFEYILQCVYSEKGKGNRKFDIDEKYDQFILHKVSDAFKFEKMIYFSFGFSSFSVTPILVNTPLNRYLDLLEQGYFDKYFL